MASKRKRVATSFFAEADRGRTPLELLAPDFTAHFPGFPAMDRDGFDQFEEMLRAGLSNIRHHLDDVVGDGDTVGVRLRLEAVHTGPFMGVPPSGEPISVEGTAFLRLTGGMVARFWGFLDQMGLMQQIGGLPAPEDAG